MRVLISAMAAMAETGGTTLRTNLLANDLRKAGIDVAMCLAEDINFKPIKGIKNYFLSIPMPLGLPSMIAVHTFPIAQKLRLTSKKSVNSFEDVLYLTGNTNYKYLKKSINEIRNAIRDFKPDVIYSEFNISAIIAGKLENKKIFISASIPTQFEYSNTPKYAVGVNKVLKEFHVPAVKSCLELFSWADKKFVPSCYELEPFQDSKVIFCGTWKHILPVFNQKKNKILVYMGNGTISQKKMLQVIISAFKNSIYQVYIAGMGLRPQSINNIHIASHFEFRELLPETAVFINHGGQNSVIDGLIYAVPQIICAGKVFERRYNAESIVKNGAGLEILYDEFSAETVLFNTEKILSDNQYKDNAAKLGSRLLALGGTENIINALQEEK